MLKKLMKAALTATLVAGLATPALAEGVTAYGVVSSIFGQYSDDEKVAAYDTDGSAKAESAAKAGGFATGYEGKIGLKYASGPISASVAIGARDDDPLGDTNPDGYDLGFTPGGNVTWAITDSMKLKFGSIVPSDMPSHFANAGSASYTSAALGAYSGLLTYVDAKGVDFRYYLNPYMSVGGALLTSDYYWSGAIENGFNEGTKKNVLDASEAASAFCAGAAAWTTCADDLKSAIAADKTALDAAKNEGKGSGMEFGFTGALSAQLILAAGYYSGKNENSDGGISNNSTGMNLLVNFNLSPAMKFYFSYQTAERNAYTGWIAKNTNAWLTTMNATGVPLATPVAYGGGANLGMTPEVSVEYKQSAMALHAAIGLGPGTLKVTYGTMKYVVNAYGSELKSSCEDTTDIDFVFQIPLTESKTSGFEAMLLTKETKPGEGDTIKKQFVGGGLYAKF
ncbi:MAG: hypothetical protein GY866_12510 [Proteobacteria bacterium]|nr:hypothetical protein [Pseudomonadota bacterium]